MILFAARRRLDDKIRRLHRLEFVDVPDGTVTVICAPGAGCGHAITGCTDYRHAAEQHLAYARHVEAGHIGRGHYLPTKTDIPRPRLSSQARIIR